MVSTESNSNFHADALLFDRDISISEILSNCLRPHCITKLNVAAAGIPDFRTPGTGLYDNLQKYNLSNPTDIFNISFFKVKQSILLIGNDLLCTI